MATLQKLPAIDRDRLSGDPVGERRGQEDDDVGDLLGVAEPAERDAAQDRAVKLRIIRLRPLPGAAGELDRARRDAVDPDALIREQGRLALRIGHDRRFYRAVGGRAGRSADPRDRRNVDDRAATALLDIWHSRPDR